MMPRLSDQLLICCSHVRTPRVGQGLLGTSRPTHYHVLNDDVGLNVDEIQRFTLDLCYMYGRCTSSVSTPAPTYYAHLAAYQSHYNVNNFREEAYSGSWDRLASMGPTTESTHLCRVMEHLHDRLYFT